MTPNQAVFNERTPECHAALRELRALMLRVGFVVEKRRDTEATLRVYTRERLTYPLLNPRFVRRRAKNLRGTSFLEITVLSKGSDNLKHRLHMFDTSPILAFEPVGEFRSPYFVHGHFLLPVSFRPGSGELDVSKLEGGLSELLRYLQ
jgi:hypothetical protein